MPSLGDWKMSERHCSLDQDEYSEGDQVAISARSRGTSREFERVIDEVDTSHDHWVVRYWFEDGSELRTSGSGGVGFRTDTGVTYAVRDHEVL